MCRSIELTSKICCVGLVSGQNPCCVGARGTSEWIMFSIRHSVILDGMQSSVLGLLEEDVVGSLFGLSILMILPSFHMFGIWQ